MTLRTRLGLVIALLVALPLLLGAVLLNTVVPDVRDDRTRRSLAAAGDTVARTVSQECRATTLAARNLGLEVATRDPQVAVRDVVPAAAVDYAAVLDTDGAVVAEEGEEPPGGGAAWVPECTPHGEDAWVGARVPLEIEDHPELRWAVTGSHIDERLLEGLAENLGLSSVSLVNDGEVVATTASAPDEARMLADAVADDPGPHEVGGFTVLGSDDEDYTVVVAEESPEFFGQDFSDLLVVVVVTAVVLGGLTSAVLARRLTEPLGEVTAAVEQVAAGDLAVRVEERSRDEVGRLARSVNHMAEQLRSYVSEVERSRDELRTSIGRLGAALSSTHDPDGLLRVVLDTAMSAAGARRGVVALIGGPGGGFGVGAEGSGMVARGMDLPRGLVPGKGVMGGVAARETVVRGRLGTGPEELEPAPGELEEGEVLAAPLHRAGRVVGVLALYDPEDGQPFSASDEETVRTLASQAGIAVDNVMLHLEAQRLSITDPLTGLWNFRYLSMSLNREIERASRFRRPLAVLMLDLDHFKAVNDTHGHQRGDAVLREFAHRISEQVREVDTLARYGGEEFVLLLSETGVAGAEQVAERICLAVRGDRFGEPGEPPLRLTVSVGAAVYPDHGGSPATLLRSADRALYAAKNAGRDRWRIAGTGIDGEDE